MSHGFEETSHYCENTKQREFLPKSECSCATPYMQIETAVQFDAQAKHPLLFVKDGAEIDLDASLKNAREEGYNEGYAAAERRKERA